MDFVDLFKDIKIGDVWPYTKNVIRFKRTDKVGACLKVLETEGILSGPVMSEDGKVLGFVDSLDIVLFVIGLFPREISPQHITEQELHQVLETGKKFDQTEIGDVLELSSALHIGFESYFPVTKADDLRKLTDLFYLGVHRAPVVSDDNSVLLNVISQSDLLSVLAQLLPLVKETERFKSIDDLGIARKELVTVSKNERAITVLSKMNKTLKQPILSAVPVVDEKTGKLVATFSASNLRGLHRSNFGFLLLPVLDFLDLQPKKPFLVAMENQKAKHPVTVTPDTLFENVVLKMVASRVHRVWVVDNQQKPVGVVSIGDAFKVLLPWTRNTM